VREYRVGESKRSTGLERVGERVQGGRESEKYRVVSFPALLFSDSAPIIRS